MEPRLASRSNPDTSSALESSPRGVARTEISVDSLRDEGCHSAHRRLRHAVGVTGFRTVGSVLKHHEQAEDQHCDCRAWVWSGVHPHI